MPPARRPGTARGLNRFLWDLKYPGPTRLDPALAPPRPTPLVPDIENPPGPTVVPGRYGVELSVGDTVQAAEFEVVKDPRLGTTPEAYAAQFALHRALVDALSRLKAAVNRLRLMKRQLGEIAARAGKGQAALRTKARRLVDRLSEIESILVDPKRMSSRDVLRHPAGLNDTLLDLIAMTTTADAAPTSQTRAVSQEIMDRIDQQIARYDALVSGDVRALNGLLAKAKIGHVGA